MTTDSNDFLPEHAQDEDVDLWFRSNVNTPNSYFLRGKSDLLFAHFQKLIGYVKLHSPHKGQIKVKSMEDLAYALRILPEEAWSLSAMIKGAVEPDPADGVPTLKLEGRILTVVKWHQFQSPGAKRTRELRQRQQSDRKPFCDAQTDSVTPKERLSVTNGECDAQTDSVTQRCRATETETETVNTEDKSSGADAPNTPYASVERVLAAVHKALGWQAVTPTDVRRHLKKDDPVQVLLKQFGEEIASKLFVHAEKTWDQPPSWKSVCEHRNQLHAGLKSTISPIQETSDEELRRLTR